MLIVAATACQVTQAVPADDESTRGPVAQDRADDQTPRGQIEAASRYLDAGDLDAARATIEMLSARRLESSIRIDADHLRARLALADGNADAALGFLAGMHATERESERQRSEHQRVLAQHARLKGRFDEAAMALFTIPQPTNREAAQALNDEIWNDLMRIPGYQIAARAAASSNVIAAGWWSIANLANTSFDLAALRRGLVDWQRSFADHPAASPLPSALIRASNPQFSPRNIALMVPLSGPLAGAGKALRDGFLTAFYRSESDRRVLVYDTASTTFPSAYEQALLDAAEVIVGPLDKSAVSAANAMGSRTLPTLALNYLAPHETATAGFYQIGLAIEDEAAAIADRIIADGVKRVALFSTGSDWSARAANEIRARLAGSSTVLVSDTYISDTRTTTEVVGHALLVPESTARRSELESALGIPLEFIARRRHDLDAIIALTDATSTRALQPALAFHFAGDVPVYATSQITLGSSKNFSRDFDGVRVTQMPWRVFADSIRRDVEEAFPAASAELDSLYALGVDAYRVMDRLGALAASPWSHLLGATGVLNLDDRQAFRRTPVWAVIRDGALVALPVVVPST